MRLLTILFLYLALAINNTFAKLPLPEGYWITAVTDFGSEKTSESRDNLHAPLLNATLTCYFENHATLLWRNYDLWSSGWCGVSEKSIEYAAANANACMTRWKFETWNTTYCDENDDPVENLSVWYATFRRSQTLSTSWLMTQSFEKLTGLYSRKWKDMVEWKMTNGTHERWGNLTEAYPPHGHMFNGICQGVEL